MTEMKVGFESDDKGFETVRAIRESMNSNGPGTPPVAVHSSTPVVVAPDWPTVLGVFAIVAGVVAFLVPPHSSYSGVVNFPTMFLQYGVALTLVLGGVLFACTGALMRFLAVLRNR